MWTRGTEPHPSQRAREKQQAEVLAWTCCRHNADAYPWSMSMTNASETGHVDAFNFGDLDRNTMNAIQAMPASKGHVAMLLD